MTDPISQLDRKTRQAVTIVAELIYKKYYHVDWDFAARFAGIEIDPDKHPRLIRSQTFGDPDYPSAILRFLDDTYSQDEEAARQLIHYIIKDSDEIPESYRSALVFLKVLAGEEATFAADFPSPVNYVNIQSIPDDFYGALIEQINRAYRIELYSVVMILARKLFENAIIDILRKRYGYTQLSVFYYKEENRFHDFGRLLHNSRDGIKKGDFISVKDMFDDELIDRIDKFRDSSNSHAHSIIVRMARSDIDSKRDEINDIAKRLFRCIHLLTEKD